MEELAWHVKVEAMRRASISLAVVSALASSALAQSDAEKATRAMNNLQQEMTICIAFYAIGKVCVEPTDADLAAKFDAVGEVLLQGAFEVGTAISMTQDAMLSRLTLEQKEMQALIANNCVNISSLINRYADRCHRLVEESGTVMNEFFAKEGLTLEPSQ